MSSKAFVVIEVKNKKAVRMIKWTRNKDGELQYKVTKPKPISNSNNPDTISAFWTSLAVAHQFYDLETKRFFNSYYSFATENAN